MVVGDMVLKTIPIGVGLPIAEGVKFINDAIEAAEQAKIESTTAISTANTAKDSAEQTRVELDQAILSGDSSPLAGQLSVGSGAVTYPSAQERFLQEYQGVSSQLADNEEELIIKEPYQGSLVDLIKKHSALRNDVIVKVASVTQIDIGIFHQADKATIYTFKQDLDGWWRLFDAVIRPMKKIEVLDNYKKSVNYVSTNGVFSKSDPTHYTTENGASFTIELEGTGFNFNSRTDNRGGIWEIVVDGYITKTISTFSTTTANNVSQLVVKRLLDGIHTAVATFKGADPNNVPSDGIARGWVNYYTSSGTTPRTITPYINSYSQVNGISVLQVTSRKEFAFAIRPSGTLMSARWVPEHGNVGAMKNVITKILFSNKEVTDIASETTNNYRIYRDVKFIVNYDAYYTENDTIAWSGRINQTINGRGYHNSHKFNFLADIEIVAGYPVMMAVAKSTTSNDHVITSLGQRAYLNPATVDGSSVELFGEPKSVAHFTKQSGSQEAKNIAIAFEVFDYKRTMRIGEEGRPIMPTRVELRTDGERKTYFGSFDYHTVNAGESYDFGFTYFIGEIYNSSEVFAS